MHVHLQSHSHVSLLQLLLAFPLSVSVAHGRLVLRRRGYERVGWPANGDLDSAFHDRFGLSMEAARRLAVMRAAQRQRSVA